MKRRAVKRLLERSVVPEPSADLPDRIIAEIPDELGSVAQLAREPRPRTTAVVRWCASLAAVLVVAIAAVLGLHSLNRGVRERSAGHIRPEVERPPSHVHLESHDDAAQDLSGALSGSDEDGALDLGFAGEVAVVGDAMVVDVMSGVTGTAVTDIVRDEAVVPAPAGSGRGTWRRSRLAPNRSRLSIGDDEELPLAGVEVQVQIDGFRARVVLDLLYRNDHGRQCDGIFQLRLPAGASPFYLAFGKSSLEQDESAPTAQDVARSWPLEPEVVTASRREQCSEVREARVVPRAAARRAYDLEAPGQGGDPAFMEWAGTGVLRARVFPLIPGALHRIVVGYDLDLDQVGDDLEYRLDLPDLDVDKVVTLRVLELADTPIVVTPEAEGRPNDGRIEYNLSGRDLSTITVRLQAPGTIVLHTTDDRVGPLFASRLRPEVPTRMASHPMREVVFAVDVSLSSNPERFNIWLDLVEAILEANRSSINRFAVVFFNVESFWWRPTFVINSWENVTQLRMFADGLALEGATDIVAALSEATNPTQLDIKETRPLRRWPVFLLSDGAATWGKDLAPQLETDGHPVFVFTTGLRGADASALAQIARSTGGAVFSVTDESEVRAASSAHRLQSCRLEAVEAAGTSDVLIAGRPLNVYPGQTLTVVGRGVPEGSIRFWLSSAAGYKDPVVEVRPRHVIESELALRSYGQVATELLESRGAPAAADATAYASYFRVIGRSCSLLMLENERDYQRLGIAESDHRATVAAHPVSTVIAALPEEAGREPALRRWLMDWLDAHGTHDQWLAGLKKGIEALPAASFEVEVEPLRCRLRRSKQIPPELGSHLASGEVTADELHAEAERRIAAGSPADALRTISSLAEGFPDNPSVLRDVALAGSKWGFGGHAYHLLRRCAETRCSRPEVFSEMAQVLAHAGHADLAIAYFEVALSAAGQGDLGRAIEGSYLDLLRRVKAGELDTKLGELVDPRIEALTGYHVES